MDFGDGQMGDIPTRPMRVKILYTFDTDNKTNCLARFPDVFNIPAVAIDENSQVGVIELTQCIQAIVSASPELVSRLSDGDFTIYAYDYSEYDTPLVGQGMLSAALAASNAQQQQQNKTMITGRVCKNMLALFNNGVKETLEVKLRLVPVPKAPAQTEIFTKRMESFRSMSPAVSAGFDPNAWSASINQNNSQRQQLNDYFEFEALANSGNERDMALVDDIFGLGSASSGSGSGQMSAGGVGVGIAETPTGDGFNPAFAAHSHSAPGSRAGSPMMVSESSSRNDALRHQSFSGNPSNFGASNADQSRPGSRANVRSEVQPSRHQRQESAPSVPQQNVQQQTEIYYNEDGQPRKRAKVMQTDWRGRSSFGSRSADLRVNAATAASVHMHRPIPKRPSAPGSNLEPPPRVPTPVPQMNPLLPQNQQQQAPRRSLLHQQSAADSDFLSDIENFSDAIISSPEEGEDDSPSNSVTAEGTPQEIPSSPPVFNQPQPSSPGLPTLPPQRMADSGYMSSERNNCFTSGNVVENLENGNEEDRSPDALDYEIAAQHQKRGGQQQHTQQPVVKIEGGATSATLPPPYPTDVTPSEMNIELETPGDMNELPHKMILNLPPGRPREGSQGPTKPTRPAPVQRAMTIHDLYPAHNQQGAATATTPAASEASGSRRGSLALPPNPLPLPPPADSQKPQPKKRQPLQRTRTSSNESEAGSPAPSDNEGSSRPRGSQRSGSGAARRKLIEQRLQSSIAKGEMPQYCSHCGAIETPTWRHLYVKEFPGAPGPLDSVEGEGETVGVEVTDRDKDSGDATKFLVRKSMKRTKDSQPGKGFEDVLVCNPCGLWFNKFKVMRPSEKWGRKAGTRKSKKRKGANEELDGEGDDAAGMGVGIGFSTDGFEPQSEMGVFTDQVMPDDAAEDADGEGEGHGQFDGAGGGIKSLRGMLPPSKRPRANSLQARQRPRGGSGNGEWNASQLDAALTRAVQSSPARFQGSQESPIEVDDLTPKPTRRILFPSPRKDGEVKSLDDNGQVSLKSTLPPFSQSGKMLSPSELGFEMDFDGHTHDMNVFEAFTFDKENMNPQFLNGTDGDEDDEELRRLFEGSPTALFKTPAKKAVSTPRSLRQLNHLLKTPSPGRSGSSRKRKALMPNANAANGADMNANGEVNDFMTSPSSSRYFLRSTPVRLSRNNTPGRRSNNSGGDEVSPWSRQLAQMLSDNYAYNHDGFTTSPSRGMDFSDLPTFNTPGRKELESCDWGSLEGLLSSEFASYGDGEEGGSEAM